MCAGIIQAHYKDVTLSFFKYLEWVDFTLTSAIVRQCSSITRTGKYRPTLKSKRAQHEHLWTKHVLRLPESAKTLELVGNKITFQDLRAEPLAEAELEELLVELGDRLADRTTNDYHTLKTWLKTLK